MTQDGLLLLVLAFAGIVAFGWTRRLAPIASELPLKTLLASLAAAAVGIAALAGVAPPGWLPTVVAVAGAAWVAGPLVVRALAHWGWWRAADGLVWLLYWSGSGRDAARRLLAEVALQRGEGQEALARMPAAGSAVLAAQAHATLRDWPAVLAVELPAGPAGAPGRLARVEALLALRRLAPATELVAVMRRDVEDGPPDPLAYRALFVAGVMVDAEVGNLRRVQEALRSVPAGVAPEVPYALLARAFEVAGEPEAALRVHAEAYRVRTPARRRRHAAALEAAGRPLPTPLRASGRMWATLSLVGALALAFVGQLLLDGAVGPFGVSGVRVAASSIAGAFVIGIPGFPQGDAAWRVLSYAFVHASPIQLGLFHVGFNLWVLFDLGRLVELRRGAGYLLAAFVAGTAMGAYLTGVAQPTGPLLLVGASGGVLGVAGALLADVSRRRDRVERQLLGSLLRWMLLIAIISLAIPNVSWWGHVGGVVGGLLWGFARQGLPADRRLDLAFGAVGVLALAWAFGQVARVALALL